MKSLPKNLIEPGQIYQLHSDKQLFVIVEPYRGREYGWLTFNLTWNRYEWDHEANFITQYRRLA